MAAGRRRHQLLIRTALALALCAGAARAEPVVEVLHMEAHEGGGAGGHAGIRLGDQVYHFEYGERGRLWMARDPWPEVVRHYADIENRPIHGARLRVSEETATLLRRAFNSRFLDQQRDLDRVSRWRAAAALFEAWAAQSEADSGADVAVVGHFFASLPPPGASARGSGSAALARVRARVGERELRVRRRALAAELSSLGPDGDAARRYREILEEQAALWVLERAPGLRADGMVEPDPRAPALTADERAALWRLAERLEGEATTLLDSRRPDRGRAWLAVAARLAAVEASIDHGRWWLVDTYDPAAPRLTAEAARRRPDVVRRSHAAARALWAEARRDFARSGAPDERRLARLERAGNRLAEWRAADQDGRLPRPEDPLATPARAAGWRGAPRPEGAEWARAARDARARVRVLERELDAVHRYDLVRRNCASEIFQVIHDALAELDPEGGVEAESVRRLGGYVPPGRGLAFVPFVSQWEVRRRYRVAETWTIPSWRDRQWRALAEREADWWVALRESTRFGARTYRPNPQDSFFLFFTERAAPVRPVLGAANVVAGLAQATAGLFTWPFDRGRRIVDGLKGVAVSLPELAFVNIRKGTNEWLPPEDVVQQDSARQTPAPVDQGRVRMSLQPPKGLRSAVADSR